MFNTIAVRTIRAIVIGMLLFMLYLVGMPAIANLFIVGSNSWADLEHDASAVWASTITCNTFLLSYLFLTYRIGKKRRGIRQRAVWKIIVTHVIVLTGIYGIELLCGATPKTALLSITLLTAFVGIARLMTIPDMLFRIYIVNYSWPYRWRLI